MVWREEGEAAMMLTMLLLQQQQMMVMLTKMTPCVTESANNQKLMLEYEKFQEQQAKMMKMQEDYDRQLQEMEESKERALEELTEYYETKLQEMTTKLEQVGKQTVRLEAHL